MAKYSIEDSTLTALGDAVRSKVIGTSELPIATFTEQRIQYNKVYSFEFPTYVKKIKIVGTGRYIRVWDGNVNGYQGVGIAPGVYTSEHKTRGAEGYIVAYTFDMDIIYDEKYFDFEAMVEGNSFTLVASEASSSSTEYYLTYTAIGLDENGNEFKYTPLEMVDEIDGLMTIPDFALEITDSINQRFISNYMNWFFEICGDKITTKDISSANAAFSNSNQLKTIPFSMNFKQTTGNILVASLFSSCSSLENLPEMNNLRVGDCSQMFNGCTRLRYFPPNFFDTWDFDSIQNSTNSMMYLFSGCYSLRKIPSYIQTNWINKSNASYSSCYNYRFQSCYTLDEVIDFGVSTAALTSNVFTSCFNNCSRIKDMTFVVNEDGTPKTANWKGQTIDLSGYIGYANVSTYILNYNSGITADKEVKDDATYQALKNDPDWFSCDINYSRYNHDSAVNTINSLPDCSATGTNTIKFKGASGAKTDGGAINTLTEAEIAVAAAKGWSVALV